MDSPCCEWELNKLILIGDNDGTETCDRSIAEAKSWEVIDNWSGGGLTPPAAAAKRRVQTPAVQQLGTSVRAPRPLRSK